MEIVKCCEGCWGCEITADHISLPNEEGDSELTAEGQGRIEKYREPQQDASEGPLRKMTWLFGSKATFMQFFLITLTNCLKAVGLVRVGTVWQ